MVKRKRNDTDLALEKKDTQGDESDESLIETEDELGKDELQKIDMDMKVDDEWSGFGGESSDIRSNELVPANPLKPPNRDELREIKEASDLYKSNTFKLKIDALLPNVRPKESRIPPLEAFLRALHDFLMDLPPVAPEQPLKASKRLAQAGVNVFYSLPSPTGESKWTVAFEKPTRIAIVGSWGNNVRTKGKDTVGWTVDVAVEMPSNLFSEKDYLDGRFFHKRSFYLAHMASAISSSKFDSDISYEVSQMDERLSSLIITSPKDSSQLDFSKLNARVRLIPYLSTFSTSSIRHLSPSHANLRFRVKGSEDLSSDATPIYNNDILLCLSPLKNLVHHHTLIQEVPAFRDALSLLRIWAYQRGYCTSSEGRYCISGFEGRGYFWPALLSYLIVGDEGSQKLGKNHHRSRKPVGKGLSSYQLFRAALDFLASHNFVQSPVLTKGATLFSADEYKEHHELVFVDLMSINVLAGVPSSSLDVLRHDAQLTLKQLNKSTTKEDPFSEVFLIDHRLALARFDVFIRVDLSGAKLRDPSLSRVIDFGSEARYLIHRICSVLKKGLSDRAVAIAAMTPTMSTRTLKQKDSTAVPTHAEIGIVLNTSQAFRLVERGPPASDVVTPELSSFREFWGERSELRQFKDGRIEESVVWEAKSTDERALVPFKVIQHLLKRHFSLDGGKVVIGFQKDFDELIRVTDTVSRLYRSTNSPVGFKGAMTRFDELVKVLKSMDEELPLAVLNVSPVTPYLRYSSVFAPLPISDNVLKMLPEEATFLPCMEVVLQFERSTRWPDDLEAIQKMKLAFYERMGTALMIRLNGLRARVAVAESSRDLTIADHSRLEIVTADGWAFSIRIWHDREATLLDRILSNVPPALAQLNSENASNAAEKRRAQQALDVYTRRFIHAPKHHRAIANLTHLFPAYPGTVRLVKRWLASHWLLDGQVSEEAIELICASIFVSNDSSLDAENIQGQLGVPGTKESGFFKTLAFLKDWEWEAGLFVPLYERDRTDVVSVKAGLGGAGVWTISTKEDPQGRVWTSTTPDVVSARRIRNLATSSWHCLKSLSEGTVPPKMLFSHPTDDYDILIHTDVRAVRRQHQRLETPTKSQQLQISKAQNVRPDFDPIAMFYHDLCQTYSGTLKFFYDKFGGSVIGGVWDPKLLNSRPFRVFAGYSSIPIAFTDRTSKKDSVVVNKDAIIEEIKRIGEGIVLSITIKQ